MNINSRKQHPRFTQKRCYVPDDLVDWNTEYKQYNFVRPYYIHEAVKNNYSGVEIRKDGKISEHVKRVLKDKEYLNTQKKLNIDETANNLNYCFAKNKPFYVINRISKDAVPQGADGKSGSKLGKSARDNLLSVFVSCKVTVSWPSNCSANFVISLSSSHSINPSHIPTASYGVIISPFYSIISKTSLI